VEAGDTQRFLGVEVVEENFGGGGFGGENLSRGIIW